jgi:hypothetical protein
VGDEPSEVTARAAARVEDQRRRWQRGGKPLDPVEHLHDVRRLVLVGMLTVGGDGLCDRVERLSPAAGVGVCHSDARCCATLIRLHRICQTRHELAVCRMPRPDPQNSRGPGSACRSRRSTCGTHVILSSSGCASAVSGSLLWALRCGAADAASAVVRRPVRAESVGQCSAGRGKA